jgi:hypothetical protein
MGMNPRLLRPILSGDPDALRYIAAVQQADQQSLEPAVRKAITDFIVGCKTDGIWSAIKASCILMGARTLSGALVPLVGSAPTNNNFVTGDYNRQTGLLGDGTNKYLDSNRSNGADPQNNVHQSVYVSTMNAAGAVGQSLIGYGGAVTGSTVIVRAASPGDVFWRNRSATTDPVIGLSAVAGFWGHRRSTSSQFVGRSNGASVTYNRTSEDPGSQKVFVFARSSDVGALELPCPHRFAFYSIGESLDLALLDTRVTNLFNAIGAALP